MIRGLYVSGMVLWGITCIMCLADKAPKVLCPFCEHVSVWTCIRYVYVCVFLYIMYKVFFYFIFQNKGPF